MRTPVPSLVLVLVTALLCACSADRDRGVEATPLMLRSYAAPAGREAEVASALNNLLWRGEGQAKAGSASVGPAGQVLVAAPESFQDGVQTMIDRVKDVPTSTSSIVLEVWLVVGAPADKKTDGATVAKPIADVLEQIQASEGPMQMALLESARVAARPGADSRVSGKLVAVEQQSTLTGETVMTNLKIRSLRGPGGLEVKTAIPLGKTVLLGQAGADGDDNAGVNGPHVTTFYVVRASIEK